VTVPPLTPAGLRCAHQVDPLGVAPGRVRLSWRLEGAGTGRAQRAYQVQVANEAGAVAWDSGRVESAVTADIAYAGVPLTAGGRYSWKVQVWDEAGTASGWSDPARSRSNWTERAGGTPPGSARAGSGRASPRPPGPGPVDPVARALTPAPTCAGPLPSTSR
jgi:hypothetical protein